MTITAPTPRLRVRRRTDRAYTWILSTLHRRMEFGFHRRYFGTPAWSYSRWESIVSPGLICRQWDVHRVQFHFYTEKL